MKVSLAIAMLAGCDPEMEIAVSWWTAEDVEETMPDALTEAEKIEVIAELSDGFPERSNEEVRAYIEYLAEEIIAKRGGEDA